MQNVHCVYIDDDLFQRFKEVCNCFDSSVSGRISRLIAMEVLIYEKYGKTMGYCDISRIVAERLAESN